MYKFLLAFSVFALLACGDDATSSKKDKGPNCSEGISLKCLKGTFTTSAGVTAEYVTLSATDESLPDLTPPFLNDMVATITFDIDAMTWSLSRTSNFDGGTYTANGTFTLEADQIKLTIGFSPSGYAPSDLVDQGTVISVQLNDDYLWFPENTPISGITSQYIAYSDIFSRD
jgi:hypothetical protein